MFEDDNDDGIMSQVLPVNKKWTDELLERRMAEGPPSSAEEYMARVR